MYAKLFDKEYAALSPLHRALVDDVRKIIVRHAETLDDAERMAQGTTSTFPYVIVYRGGSHVAVILHGVCILQVFEGDAPITLHDNFGSWEVKPAPAAPAKPRLYLKQYRKGGYYVRESRYSSTILGTVYRSGGDWVAVSFDGYIARQGRTRDIAIQRMLAAVGARELRPAIGRSATWPSDDPPAPHACNA